MLTSIITVYCGLFFIAKNPEDWIKNNPDYSNGSVSLGEKIELFFFAVILISNLAFVIFWAYKMYQELKSKFREKLPKIYLALCLCLNKQKLD